jgi:glyoxalase family protein
VAAERVDGRLRFADPEGLGHELTVDGTGDPPLTANHPDIPAEHALRGFDSVRAYSRHPEASTQLLEALEFERTGDGWEARGSERGGTIAYDTPPAEAGRAGGGTVHHVAWSAGMDEQPQWQERAARGGAHPTEVIDRFWFHSIYFREPSGVLFEIATRGPGFHVDEEREHLGEKLVLPPKFEPMRERIEQELTPLDSPRPAAR